MKFHAVPPGSVWMRFLTYALLLSSPILAAPEPLFIGTRSGGPGQSKGIYRAEFDPVAGTLSKPVLAIEHANPGFLALHPTKPILYTIGGARERFDDGSDAVAAYAIGESQQLSFLGEASSGGKGICHLTVDATGRTIAAANYGDGSISTIRLDEAGVPEKTVSVIKHSGRSVHPERQKGPHAHGVNFDQANRHLFVPDLGLDQVLIYPFDAATSSLGEPLAPFKTAPGAGPRHLAFSPDHRHAYVINELDNTLQAATHHDGQGRMENLAALPTLPDGFTEFSTTAEVEVHPNGKWVYASNRGHDSIAVYARDAEKGTLTFLQHAPCGGKTPRHFKIHPGGKWLLCGHQDSNTISVLALDPDTGLLSEPSETVAAPHPICLLFAR